MLKNLRTVFRPNKPWIYVNNQTNCEGILCHLIKYLSKSLNFSYNLILDDEGQGFKLPNGQWSGVFGRFQRNV